MATIRNVAGEPRFIPLAGRVVEDGDEFEVDDVEFDRYHFGEGFRVVTEPARKAKPKPGDEKKES